MKKMNAKAKQKMLAGIAIIVVVILVTSGIYVYDKYYKEEEKDVEEIEERVIDDRISPLENQGVTIEILRLRHRGLHKKLTTPGNSWKTKPTFYFVTKMDGLEYVSSQVEQHGEIDETFFNTWDTMFQENKIVKDTEEEQETSMITLTIFEIVTTGIIFKKTKTIERDSITLEYDYRTGRWSGDDNFKDYDGYGYYLGETFEIWFNIYQMDSDNDYIPYWTEVNVLGIDPRRDDSKNDPDGDGIPTAWEWKWGYDPFTWDDHEKLDPDVDGLENIEEYQMTKWLANPFAQDVYVEVDSIEGRGLFDPPTYLYEECQQAVIEKYAEHNIKLFFDDGWPDTPKNGGGELLPYYKRLSQDSGMILQFYNHNFPDERKGIFRYIVIGHEGGYNHPAKGNIYDCIHLYHDPMVIYRPIKAIGMWLTKGLTPTDRGNKIALAAMTMHELGHSIGIGVSPFEGVDNISFFLPKFPGKNYKYVDYRSVMNYHCMRDTDLLDYSDGSNGPPYDQNDWEKLFVATFQYNAALIEEPFFEPPGLDKYVYGETEIGVTGYVFDEELTEDFTENMGDWSPVDPIDANWSAFRLVDKDKYPHYKNVKILVQPTDVPYAEWAEYAEGNLDSEGNIKFYSQQDIIDEIMEQL